MAVAHHDPTLEFPEYRDRIAHMEACNTRFARLMGEYRDISEELYRIAADLEMPAAAYVEGLQKRRSQLRDVLHRVLSAS